MFLNTTTCASTGRKLPTGRVDPGEGWLGQGAGRAALVPVFDAGRAMIWEVFLNLGGQIVNNRRSTGGRGFLQWCVNLSPMRGLPNDVE